MSEDTKSTKTRWKYTNDILAFVLTVVVVILIYVGVTIPQFLQLAFLVSIVWAFGSAAYETVKK